MFLSGVVASSGGGREWRAGPRARSPRGVHTLDPIRVDPGVGGGGRAEDGPLPLPRSPPFPQGVLPEGGGAGSSPADLVFGASAGRLLVRGGGRRLARPLTTPGAREDLAASALGSISSALHAARRRRDWGVGGGGGGLGAEGLCYRFTLRLGALPPADADDAGIAIGFADRLLPMESFGAARNSVRYAGCYYLHLPYGGRFAPAQGVVDAPLEGWARAAKMQGARGLLVGDKVSCILMMEERCMRYEWNDIDCGVAFRNIDMSRSLFPAVEMNSAGYEVELI
ncbi:unnamed protein product [Phytomonas sp. EM1]|nr:unnamed protein product [Phytomonas sp. EM1]|eukprot:CCW65157.1 unnamed protein product [Phytomonas sp. isolate EM1]